MKGQCESRQRHQLVGFSSKSRLGIKPNVGPRRSYQEEGGHRLKGGEAQVKHSRSRFRRGPEYLRVPGECLE